jgi:drug/metabolite transporter (DMT)-like permease
MNNTLIIIVISCLLTMITIVGNILLKEASLREGFNSWMIILVAGLIYGISSPGWVYLMRKATLVQLEVIFTSFCLIVMALISIFWYKEAITWKEYVGIILALVAQFLMMRIS